MKNVLIIIPSLKLWWWAEKIATTIWLELYKMWYKIDFFTFYDATNKYNFLWNEFCLKENLNNNILVKIIKLFSRAFKISQYCKKNKINSIISHMEDANFSSILSKLFWNKTKITVVIHHSISDYGKWLYYWLIKIFYKYADNIVVLTKFEKDNLVNKFWIKDEKVLVIPNSVNIEQINKLKNENLWEYEKLFKKNKFTFITTGRLNKIKNQKLMINAFVNFNKKYKDSQLIILWDGDEKENLKKIANENVYFLWNQKNVFKYLNYSDCFLLSSNSESFSIAIIEAMACWLPIISTNTQWPNEILDNWEYWIITKNNDEKEFYEAMEEIFKSGLIKDKYINQSKIRIKKYGIEYLWKNWISLC